MSDEQNNTEYPNPMDDNKSYMIFYHMFMAFFYGGVGFVLGALIF